MELIACICVAGAVPLYTKNALHRLTKHTVRETRAYMRRYAIIYAVYSHRLANAIITQRIYKNTVDYDEKGSFTFKPVFRTGQILLRWPVDATMNHKMSAFRDITIVASESLYMQGTTSPRQVWLSWGFATIVGVTLTCVQRDGKYRYQMRLPTRYNPICCCCHSMYLFSIALDQDYVGLRPEYELKKIIDHVKVKLLHRDEHILHSCIPTTWYKEIFTRPISEVVTITPVNNDHNVMNVAL